MQVVTNANMMDLIQGKQIPDFKPPEAAPADATKPADVKVDAAPAAETAKAETDKPTPPRGEDGKFVKAEGETQAAGDEKKPDQKADPKVDADDDVVLTKKIERLINKKHRAMKEAEEFGAGEARRAIEAERKAADLQRQIDELKGTKSVGQPAATGDEPKPEDFKTVGEYTRALVKWEAKQAGKSAAEHAEVSRQQAEANQIIAGFVERQEAFMKATPDYEEVLESADFEIPPVSQQYLVESEYGPQLAYHLAKNPDVATSLRKLSPRRQLAELGKLEVKFEKPVETVKTAPAANGISKAPAPIQPLDAKSTPVQKDPKDMSFQELRAFRQAQAQAKRA